MENQLLPFVWRIQIETFLGHLRSLLLLKTTRPQMEEGSIRDPLLRKAQTLMMKGKWGNVELLRNLKDLIKNEGLGSINCKMRTDQERARAYQYLLDIMTITELDLANAKDQKLVEAVS